MGELAQGVNRLGCQPVAIEAQCHGRVVDDYRSGRFRAECRGITHVLRRRMGEVLEGQIGEVSQDDLEVLELDEASQASGGYNLLWVVKPDQSNAPYEAVQPVVSLSVDLFTPQELDQIYDHMVRWLESYHPDLSSIHIGRLTAFAYTHFHQAAPPADLDLLIQRVLYGYLSSGRLSKRFTEVLAYIYKEFRVFPLYVDPDLRVYLPVGKVFDLLPWFFERFERERQNGPKSVKTGEAVSASPVLVS